MRHLVPQYTFSSSNELQHLYMYISISTSGKVSLKDVIAVFCVFSVESVCSTAVGLSTVSSPEFTFVPLALCQAYVYLSLCLMSQMFQIGPQLQCQPPEPAKVNR